MLIFILLMALLERLYPSFNWPGSWWRPSRTSGFIGINSWRAQRRQWRIAVIPWRIQKYFIQLAIGINKWYILTVKNMLYNQGQSYVFPITHIVEIIHTCNHFMIQLNVILSDMTLNIMVLGCSLVRWHQASSSRAHHALTLLLLNDSLIDGGQWNTGSTGEPCALQPVLANKQGLLVKSPHCVPGFSHSNLHLYPFISFFSPRCIHMSIYAIYPRYSHDISMISHVISHDFPRFFPSKPQFFWALPGPGAAWALAPGASSHGPTSQPAGGAQDRIKMDWLVYFMENPTQMDDLGSSPISGNLHVDLSS